MKLNDYDAKRIEIMRVFSPEAAQLELDEIIRQERSINLIASENYAPLNVRTAIGGVYTNKYTEGYAGKRYYGGCALYDKNEVECINLVKKLFGLNNGGANVQPHSGSQANQAVLFTLLNNNDKIMNFGIYAHLTHGMPVNLTGKLYSIINYADYYSDGSINYDSFEAKAKQEKPKLIIAGASSYPRVFDWKRIREIANEIGAYFMADIAHYAGLIAAGEYPNPLPYAHAVTFTTQKTMRGPRGGVILWTSELEELLKKSHGLFESIDKALFPGLQGGPLQNNILAKRICFENALTEDFKKYQMQVRLNAKALSDYFTSENYKVVTGGTDSHLILIDIRESTILNGSEIQELLEKYGIIMNKNIIPFDNSPPSKPRGIRLGSPATTTRGFKEEDIKLTASLINELIHNREIPENAVRNICDAHPYYFE